MYRRMQACKPDREELEKILKDQYEDEKTEIFKLLSNPTRFKIALLLAKGEELCTCDLEELLGCEQTLISHHMRPFKKLGLVTERRDRKWKHYSLKGERLKKILEAMR